MNEMETYSSKLMSAGEAAQLVPDASKLLLPFGTGVPPALCRALADRAAAGEFSDLRVTYDHSTDALTSTLLQEQLLEVIHPYTPNMGPWERKIRDEDRANRMKRIFFIPFFFYQSPQILADNIGYDTFILQVSPMDQHGYFSVGTSHAYSSEMIHHVGRLIVEVNRHMPRTFGDGFIHVSQVAAIVENNSPLPEYPLKPIGDVERMIARNILELIPDGATLQFGIGSVPDAVCEQLHGHRDLGVHTELISPALAGLIKSDNVTNKYKPLNRYKSVFTVVLGDKETYDFIDNNPAVEGYSVAYVNNPAVISQFDNLISINGVMQVDFTGQANAEMIDHRQFSAVGGQLDFIRGARASKGGKSVLATRSTSDQGKISKIVPLIEEVVTDTRMDTQYVVTEYGVVNLLGKSTTERALALIEIAHPDFREELLKQAKDMGMVP